MNRREFLKSSAIAAAAAALPVGLRKAAAQEDQRYYMVTFASGIDYWKDCFRGMEDAAEFLGVNVEYTGTPENDITAEVRVFDEVASQNPAGILVTVINPDAFIEPINNAIGAGIPVVCFDADSPMSQRYSFVGTGNYYAGVVAARYLGPLVGEGKVGISTRSVTVDLRKEGFLQFIYYTDKESSSPTVYYETYASSYPSYQKTYTVSNWSCTHYSTGCKSKEVFSGLTPTGAQACARYYYSVPPASGTRGLPTQTVTTYWKRKVGGSWVDQTPVTDTVTLTRSNGTAAASCDINFVGGDVINGPMYTKDALLLMPNNGYTGPHFKGTAETYWQATYDPPPSVDTGTLSKPWRKNGSTAAPVSSGYKPTIATRVLDMPPTNALPRQFGKASPS